MRKLIDITEDVLDGKKVSYEELLYSFLVYRALHYFDHQSLLNECNNPSKIIDIKFRADESVRRFQKWLQQDPKKTVGWEDDPVNPDYIARRQIGKRVIDKLMGKK